MLDLFTLVVPVSQVILFKYSSGNLQFIFVRTQTDYLSDGRARRTPDADIHSRQQHQENNIEVLMYKYNNLGL